MKMSHYLSQFVDIEKYKIQIKNFRFLGPKYKIKT